VTSGHRIPYGVIAKRLAKAGKPFIEAWESGLVTIELYQPRGRDNQKPHNRDEIYVVVKGEGHFLCDGHTRPFGAGDILFVPSWVEHRFVNFSGDLSV
jgi:mannose-6-phosphate isomerase-like protein (cupin superfamily)